MAEDLSQLRHLGREKTEYAYGQPDAGVLDVFENPAPGRAYEIEFTTQEFTSLCPVTGQPDFAAITLKYIPGPWCVESKSLKLYLFSFRQHRSFAETIANRIASDLAERLKPVWLEVHAQFTPRGGLGLNVRAQHGQKTGLDV